jgi:NADH dehydrogenase FAD-containing subunit
MGKHLVFVGGGHAHLTALLNMGEYIQRGHRVTVVGPSPYHYYSGMGPGMLSGIYRPQEVRFHVKKLVEDRGGEFREDRVVRIDPHGRSLHLQSGQEISYDFVSFNTGSEVANDPLLAEPQETVFPVKPVVHLHRARGAIRSALKDRHLRFVIIGGGAAGVEISANLWRLVRDSRGQGQITLIAGRKILHGALDRVGKIARDSFRERGIEIIEGNRATRIKKESVTLADGKILPFDFAFLAMGIRPSPLFRQSGLPTGEDGGLLVNVHLQSMDHPEIFGGGDCIAFAERRLAKVGVYAVRENPLLFQNLLASLEGKAMEVFEPQREFMLILNLGNGRGLLWRKNFVWEGRLAFLLKDYIDRKFMKKFQVSGEREEPEGAGS